MCTKFQRHRLAGSQDMIQNAALNRVFPRKLLKMLSVRLRDNFRTKCRISLKIGTQPESENLDSRVARYGWKREKKLLLKNCFDYIFRTDCPGEIWQGDVVWQAQQVLKIWRNSNNSVARNLEKTSKNPNFCMAGLPEWQTRIKNGKKIFNNFKSLL
jgi:hypothetical protein